jgi:hypothetical protein
MHEQVGSADGTLDLFQAAPPVRRTCNRHNFYVQLFTALIRQKGF